MLSIVEDELDEWTVDKHMQLLLVFYVHVFLYIYNIIFFSPSLTFTVLIYSPIYAAMHLIHMWTNYDMNDAKVLEKNFVFIGLGIFEGIFIFVLLQTTELSRFFEQ